MSKSIYDEALQELKDLEIILCYDVSKIKRALLVAKLVAKKEHELLDLYEYLNETHNEISEIEKQIKEIKNEYIF